MIPSSSPSHCTSSTRVRCKNPFPGAVPPHTHTSPFSPKEQVLHHHHLSSNYTPPLAWLMISVCIPLPLPLGPLSQRPWGTHQQGPRQRKSDYPHQTASTIIKTPSSVKGWPHVFHVESSAVHAAIKEFLFTLETPCQFADQMVFLTPSLCTQAWLP